MKTNRLLYSLLLALMICITHFGHAGIIHYSSVISTPDNGSPAVAVGSTYAKSEVFITGSGSGVDRLVQGVLTLGVNHRYPLIYASNKTKIEVLIKRWSNPLLTTADLADTTVFMEVSYSPNDSLSFIDKHSLLLSGVKRYSAEIKNVWVNGVSNPNLPGNLTLKLDLFVDRYVDFSTFDMPVEMNMPEIVRLDCDGTGDELNLSWEGVKGAEEYQLEWVFVNYYGETIDTELSLSELEYDFKHNATRISTTLRNYKITLAFDKGYICYRVRAIGRRTSDLTKIIFGVWSAPEKGDLTTIADRYKNDVAYEGNKNWQYSTTYAEEGKKKEVVSFFDGSLRNRQMVTKMNTDQNTIVGETIYDHQGRPAVQVLPVPVDDPLCSGTRRESALKFYPDFTQNMQGEAYDRMSFDFSGADTCQIHTDGMGTGSGASRYYSSDNPDQNGKQAYVPDAHKYPFSQVEYTPDNTGRIRRQSGVGEEFKLGSGHETKYYYGHPTQVQLDRMFGSEVGDYAHYQKNMVVDPNGQTSVSYLDQEGRVIATSLAGEVPDNLIGLETANSGRLIKENLLVRDAAGNSRVNKLSQDGKMKVFNETMLLSAASNVAINYNLIIDTLYTPCLASNFCINCVYDLTIRIVDDCGIDKTGKYGFGKKKVVGHLKIGEDGKLQFETSCMGEPEYNLPAMDTTIYLEAGSYQVIKSLSVNEEALEFYVDKYLDTNYNTCVKSLSDFNAEYLSKVDYTSCNPITDCNVCLAQLGTAQEFITNGRGDISDYNTAVELCTAPCKEASMSRVQFEMLLTDVSPGGQYAEYLNPSLQSEPSLFPLSVLNTSNILPASNVTGGNANWKKPKLVLNGADVFEYREEDKLTRSIVRVAPVFDNTGVLTGSNPAADALTDIHQDPLTGNYYVYPEHLHNVADFVDSWELSWANSLVTYHPEYPMYRLYEQYSVPVIAGETYTSESFDNLLRNTHTFQEAFDRGLIKSNWASQPVDQRLNDWFAVSTTLPWDPFVAHSSSYDGYGAQLQSKFNSHTGGFSMLHLASAMTRCGNTLIGASSTVIAGCNGFGNANGTPEISIETRNEEWTRFTGLYLSAKFELQHQRATLQSIQDPAYWGYNACIGNEDFNPTENGFMTVLPLTGDLGQYMNGAQPCNFSLHTLMKQKEKRYPGPSDLSQDYNSIAYQNSLLTGQSPAASTLQGFLDEVVFVDKLTTSSFSANALSTFGGFFLALNNNVATPVPATTWQQFSLTASDLVTDLVSTASSERISLHKPDTTTDGLSFVWNDIISLYGLRYLSSDGSGNHLFEIKAGVHLSGVTREVLLTGSTTYDIGDIAFESVCKPNKLARDVAALMHALAGMGELNSTAAIDLSGPSVYRDLATNGMALAATTDASSSLNWIYNPANTSFSVYESVVGAMRLELDIVATVPPTFNLANLGNVKAFSGLSATGGNTFDLFGLDASGNALVTLKCNAIRHTGSPNPDTATDIEMGTCQLPAPSWCEGVQYQNTSDLVNLLKDVMKTQILAFPGYNLFASPAMTPDLVEHLFPETYITNSSLFRTEIGRDYFDTITIYGKEMCSIVISSKNADSTDFPYIVSVASYEVSGQPDGQGRYHELDIVFNYEKPAMGGLISRFQRSFHVQSCHELNTCNSSPTPATSGIEFPTGVFTDPCTEYLTGLAYANALNAYNRYTDSLRNYISGKYIAHCMSAVEKLTRTYTDNEYHRTLYYYDQAGNLVKTVPPEGVELLDIASDEDLLALQVKEDREKQTRKVLTAHRMVTQYAYNSLNQLVKQSVPDQNPLNIWEISLPNGLQAGLNTTAIQMVSSTIGYLSGYVNLGSKIRGFLYRTENGGSNWTKVNNMIAADLKEVQLVTSTVGYAVGATGIALKTTDGGQSWDMLNTYANSIVSDFNDLYFSSATAGRFVGKNGVEMITTDGGSTFTVSAKVLPSGTITAGSVLREIKAVEPFGSSYLYTVSLFNSGGVPYEVLARGTTAATWVAESIQGAEYNAIHFYSTTRAIIAGADGNLTIAVVPSSGSTGYTQTHQESQMTNNILGVFFMNAERGIALVEEGTNKVLKYTIDGGISWSTVQHSLASYNDLQLISQTSTLLDVVVVGENSHTARIIFGNNTLPAIIDHSNYQSPGTLNLVAVSAITDGSGKRMIAATGDGKVYYSSVLGTGSQPLAYTLIGTLPAGGVAKKMVLTYFAANGTITGIIQTTSGKIYTIHRTATGGTFALGTTALGSAGAVFGDIALSGTRAFGFDNVSKNLYRMPLNNASAATATLLPITAGGTPSAIKAMAASNSRLTYVGVNGEIWTTDTEVLTVSSTTSTAHSNLRMPAINKLQTISSTDALAIGKGGLMLKRTAYNAGYTFMITPLNVSNDLNAIQAHGTGKYLVAGSKGFVSDYTYASNALTPLALNNGQFASTYFAGVDFYGTDVSGTNVYVAGTSGTVLYSGNLEENLFAYTSNVHNVSFSSVSIVPGQTGSSMKMYAVGDHSKIYRFTGTNGVEIKQVFSDTLYDVHFANAHTGAVVGKGYFARQTFDGGNTWKIILPTNVVYLNKVLLTAWSTADGCVLIAGKEYFATATNQLATLVSASGVTFSDIEFGANSPLEGWVATSSRMRKITLTATGPGGYSIAFSAYYPNIGYNINALHVFENGGVMAASNAGIFYMKPNADPATALWKNLSPPVSGITFKDVFFHDDATGYIVGSNGTNGIILRSDKVTYANSQGEISSILWTAKSYLGDGVVSSVSQVSSINAIAFGSRYNGIWGGSYGGGFTANVAYVRKIRDESSEFSAQFFYDKLGRLVVSQNSRQYAASPRKYSYSLYDGLGRVYEAGEKTENASGIYFAGIFGTMVNDLYNPAVIDEDNLNNWVTGTGARKEVTRSYYDKTMLTGLPSDFTPDEKTQRKRITHVIYEAVYDGDDKTFDHATHYDYDIHGNVKTLLQDNKKLAGLDVNLATQRFKRLDYNFDLVSGNVHRVSYQQGKADQWHHAYSYDADNRITQTMTSTTTPFIASVYGTAVMQNEPLTTPYWNKEASYVYYDHGPLARTELGQEKVQGIDYMYTLQGWLKGVNNTTLNSQVDPGGDGFNKYAPAQDAYSFGLHYYAGDYHPIEPGINSTPSKFPFSHQDGTDDLRQNSSDLYNGNIARMVTTITHPTTREVLPLGNAYRYDQLNRLKESNSFVNLDKGLNQWTVAEVHPKYGNAFTYDQNGNIMSQQRADENGAYIDQLSYNYQLLGAKKINNRLYSVDDAISAGSFPDDIDDMGPIVGTDLNTGVREVVYDEGGEWTSVSSVPGGAINTASANAPMVGSICTTVDDFTNTAYLEFNRSSLLTTAPYNYLTFFIRNRTVMEEGNLPRVFIWRNTSAYTTADIGNYGYNRSLVGEWQVISIPISTIAVPTTVNRVQLRLMTAPGTPVDFDIDQLMFTSDQQPNIVPVANYAYDGEGRLIRDKQEGIERIDWRVDGKVSKIVRPSGSAKKNVSFDYDAMGNRIAKHVLTSSDVLEKSTYYVLDASGNTMSVYERTVDNQAASVAFYQAEKHIYGSSRLGVMKEEVPLLGSQNSTYSMRSVKYSTGARTYELGNHLGNVLSVISDKVIPHDGGGGVVDYFLADIIQSSDYSPFGVTLSSRNFVKSGGKEFPYGFQNQLEDDEIKGDGNSINFTFRMHDPRLGRFFAVDPLFTHYPSNSPYAFSENRVIDMVELEGLEKANFEETKQKTLERMGTGTVISQADYDEIQANIDMRGFILHSELIFFVVDPNKVYQTSGNLPIPVGGKSFRVQMDNYYKAKLEGDERAKQGLPAVTDDAPGPYPAVTGASNLRGIVADYPPAETNTGDDTDKNPKPLNETKPTIVNGTVVPEGEKMTYSIDANFSNWKANIINYSQISLDLDALAQALKDDNTLKIKLNGMGLGKNTDVNPTSGGMTSDQTLNARANAIKRQLIKRGVNASQISIGGPIYTKNKRGVKVTATNEE